MHLLPNTEVKMSVLVDAHVHLDFYDDQTRLYSEIEKHQIYSVFMTHIPELYKDYYVKLNATRSRFIKLAVGFHPILVNEYPFNATLFTDCLETTNIVGEVGLDYVVARTDVSRSKQQEVFRFICHQAHGKVLSIHNRNAESEILEILEHEGCRKAVFHWYTGKEDAIPRILSNGYFFSVNPMMLNSYKGRSILKKIPQDKILVESDGPFTRVEGKIIEPCHIAEIYRRFEDFYGISDLGEVVRNNWKFLVR